MKTKGSEINSGLLYAKNYDVNIVITQLLCQILNKTDSYNSDLSIASAASLTKSDEVVLSIVIDEYRYTLTRSTVNTELIDVKFSPREIEIIRLICKGMANKEIASLLEISRWTVGTYLRRLFIKMGVNSRTELVAKILHYTIFSDK